MVPTTSRRSVFLVAMLPMALLVFTAATLGACSLDGPFGEPEPDATEERRPIPSPSPAATQARAPTSERTPTDPATSTPAATSTAEASPTWAETPAPSETSTATSTPRPSPPRGALIVDPDGQRIFASGPVDEEAQLLTYRTIDGKLVDSHPLREGEVLLGLDDLGRLHLRQPETGLRVLDADTMTVLGEIGVPTTGVSNVVGVEHRFTLGPPEPLLIPATGQVVTFDRRTVRIVDPASGRTVSEYEVPLPQEEGPITSASISGDGRLLYLVLTEDEDSLHLHGATILAVSTLSGEQQGRRDLYPFIMETHVFGDHFVAVGSFPTMYGGMDTLLDHWVSGRPRELLSSAAAPGRLYDSTRDRIIRQDGGFLVFDAPSLRPLFRTTAPDADRLEVYDPGTDRFFGRSYDADQLMYLDAASLAPDPLPTVEAVPAESVAFVESVLPAHQSRGAPAFLLGSVLGRSEGGRLLPVISRDEGETWERFAPAGSRVGLDPTCLAASPTFAEDQILFACGDHGVVRSDDGGRSWAPTGPGITSLELREIALSPAFQDDSTVFAASFDRWGDPRDRRGTATAAPPGATALPSRATSWRTEDGGASWEPMGHFGRIAVDRDFAENRTVMAFEHEGSRLYVSRDAGRSWEARGRLPKLGTERFTANRLWIVPRSGDDPRVLLAVAASREPPVMGGIPKSPIHSARLFRSVDDGATWDLAWPAGDRIGWSGLDVGASSPLLGPIEQESHPTWLLDAGLDPGTVLKSYLGPGYGWQSVYLAENPRARVLAVDDDGGILVSKGWTEPGLLRIDVDDFTQGPRQPPWERESRR